MIGSSASDRSIVHAGVLDAEVLVDDDPIERGDRVTGMRARTREERVTRLG